MRHLAVKVKSVAQKRQTSFIDTLILKSLGPKQKTKFGYKYLQPINTGQVFSGRNTEV